MNNMAWIGLGSNIGDRFEYLKLAITKLIESPYIELVKCSFIYETVPEGYVDQDLFLNLAVKVKTSLTAEELFLVMSDIEDTLGRKRAIHWGPRTIDLDLLLFNDTAISTDKLTIPHPRIFERCFVLRPLLETLDTFDDQEIKLRREIISQLNLLKNQNENIKFWSEINFH
jgi:2-amino-4-hydroxy-6-hydroxymethyldihydropteridine diphosphokinase